MPRHASWFSAVGLSLVLLSSAPAHASELIDFGTGSAGAGGWLSYDGVIGLNFGFSGPGGGFNALAVSSDISSVATPEPASLALMLLGKCLIGVRTLRRRVATASSSTF
jgi:hypothetical protein